jgi:hypothetical protein
MTDAVVDLFGRHRDGYLRDIVIGDHFHPLAGIDNKARTRPLSGNLEPLVDRDNRPVIEMNLKRLKWRPIHE